MIITEIIVEGFRSFAGRHSFHLPKVPGVYFMKGENRSEARLGANGAGKSTIWEALCWALYGKTSRGLKAGDIGVWGSKKGAEVIIAFEGEIDGASNWYFLKRTWKPNSWTLSNLFDATPIDLTKDETNPVLTMLRLQYEPFLHSVFMAQRADMFLDLKPEPKAALFSSVMDLDRWITYAGDASAKASDQDRITRRLESERAELKGRLVDAGDMSLEASSAEWERKRAAKLKDINEDHAIGCDRSRKAKIALEDAQAACARHEKGIQPLRDRAEELRIAESVARRLYAEAKAKRELFESELTELDKKECPTCRRPYGNDRHHEQALRAIEADHKKATEEALILATRADKADEAYEQADRILRDALDHLEGARDAVKNARRAHEMEERRLDELEEQAERLEAEKNPFADMLADRARSLAKLKEEFAAVNAQLDQSLERYSLYGFWTKGFKEVRLQLIAEALDQLEVEVNNELVALGLINWELRFDVDAETKKGTLSRGFSVTVRSPHNDAPVPWESWSGGESQRLRLAAQFGLANLIRDRTGCDLPLEVWDEPTEGLSEEGIIDLLTALNERAQRESRVIWVVDHRSLGYGGFTDSVTVVKDEKGSRIVQSRV